MSKGPFLRKYGVQTTIDFDLFEVDGVDFRINAVHAAGDTKVMKDEGVEANTTNGFTDEGQGYSIVLTATEMQAARVKVYIVDQTATKVWLDTSITVETYGNASAMHAFDLDTANVTLAAATHTGAVVPTVTTLTNLPSIPANWLTAAGIAASALDGKGDWNIGKTGYALSATGADLILKTSTFALALADAVADEALSGHATAGSLGKAITDIEADTNELQGDWVNGGRLDLLLDAIPTTAMRGTDNAALASVATEARLSELDAATAGKLAFVVDALDTLTKAAGAGDLAAVKTAADAIKVVTDTQARASATIADGTASGTPTTTTMVSDIGVTVDDQFKGRIITFAGDTTTAALRKQSTDITAATAATNTLTFTALTTAPVSGDTFSIS